MIGTDPRFDAFITAHRWAVLTVLGRAGDPSSSVVAYARDGDQLVVSTPGRTFKRRAPARDPRVNLCVISNQEPFNFVAVRGTAQVQTLAERAAVSAATRQVFANIEGTGYRLPDDLDHWLDSQDRVILRISAVAVHGVIR